MSNDLFRLIVSSVKDYRILILVFFFLKVPPTPEFSPLPLHHALPISPGICGAPAPPPATEPIVFCAEAGNAETAGHQCHTKEGDANYFQYRAALEQLSEAIRESF